MTHIPWGDGPIIVWDDINQEHVHKHGFKDWEVDEMILEGEYQCRPHPKREKEKKYEKRYLIRGKTLGGRKMLVPVDYIDQQTIRPVKAIPDE